MIVLFLTGVVAMIMLRTLRKDITTYNEMQTLEEAQEEVGYGLSPHARLSLFAAPLPRSSPSSFEPPSLPGFIPQSGWRLVHGPPLPLLLPLPLPLPLPSP